MAVDIFETKLNAIKTALEAMLTELNTELIKVAEGKGGDPKAVLDKLDAAIINDASVKRFLLGDNVQTRTAVQQIISDVKRDIQASIDGAKDMFGLSETDYESIKKDFKDNKTVQRTNALEEFRAKSDSITFDSAEDRLSATTGKLEKVEEQLSKVEGFKAQLKPGENVDVAIKRLDAEIKGTTLNEAHIKAIQEINKNTYDYDKAVTALTVDGFSYKVPENVTKTAEFLTQLHKLKDGNPEISEIFNELKKVGISIDKGTFSLNGLNNVQRRKLIELVNNGLKTKKIDFSQAKGNTSNELLNKATAEMQTVLGKDFMKLYPKEAQTWAKALKEGKLGSTIAAWNEMSKFLKEKDFELELEDIENLSKDEASLRTEKAELEAKKNALSNRVQGEMYENVPDEVNKINVKGIEIESSRNLLGLSEDDMIKASKALYNKKQKEFAEKFDKEADPSLKKVGFFERIGYAITHRTLHPKEAIIARNIEEWSRKQISAAITSEVEKVAREQGARDSAYGVGALRPDQLKDFRDKQARILAEHKQKQEVEIFEGKTKTADDASQKAKENAEAELGE